MTEALFNAVVSDGGGYENIAVLRLQNGDHIDFVGITNDCKKDYFINMGGELIVKKPVTARSVKSGEYDVTGNFYFSIDDISGVLMLDKVKELDVHSWRL